MLFAPDPAVAEAIQELVNRLLDDDISPVQLCFYLSAAGLDMGLQFAPTPHHALALVASAHYQVSLGHAGEGPDAVEDGAEASNDAQPDSDVADGPEIPHRARIVH